MVTHPQPGPLLKKIAATCRQQFWFWAVPTLLMTLTALAFALLAPDRWKASQALVVRDEAGGGVARLGRFDSAETMKASQETILEVARNPEVVAGALRTLPPPAGRSAGQPWPTARDIEKLQQQITVSAPQGAEFGKTEVIYLAVTGPTRQQAITRNNALCDQLEQHLSQLRDAKATSVIKELEETLRLSEADLDRATERLEDMEKQVGSDLGELRSLNDAGAGSSNLRSALNQVKTELRQARSAHEANGQLRQLLLQAADDPDKLLATPSRLLESQPGLRRLKEGLVDAQLHTSSLRGKMSDDHPLVVAALRAQSEVRQNLHAEISSALRGVEADLQVILREQEVLEQQQSELQQRLDKVASLRARYSNLVDNVRQRTDIVQQAKRDLADARASRNAAQSASLLTRFHEPVTGDGPEGPSDVVIVLSGLLGGLSVGAGLVFLLAPTGADRGRRWSDYLEIGRRATDRFFGRRATDQNTPAAPPAAGQDGNRRSTDSGAAPCTDAAPRSERRTHRRRSEDRDDG